MDSDCHTAFPLLGDTNYGTCVGNMRAHLMTKEVWGLVKGEDAQPGPDEPKELRQWRKDHHVAAGAIFLHLTEGPQSVVQSMAEDPSADVGQTRGYPSPKVASHPL
jgi:hypothetical protein